MEKWSPPDLSDRIIVVNKFSSPSTHRWSIQLREGATWPSAKELIEFLDRAPQNSNFGHGVAFHSNGTTATVWVYYD